MVGWWTCKTAFCTIGVDFVTSSWVPFDLLKTFDISLACPILEPEAKSTGKPTLVRAWQAALDWEKGLRHWRDILYGLRDEKRNEQSPRAVCSDFKLQMRKPNESLKCWNPRRSRLKRKCVIDDDEDNEDAAPSSKIEVKQEHESYISNISRETRSGESIKQRTDVME